MTARTTTDLSADLERTRQRFERWRRTREKRSPIPDRLWAAAVKMAERHGTHRTARALRVNYYALKKRVEEESPSSAKSPGDAPPAFLELAAPVPASSGQCTLELEDVAGAKMRVHVQGVEALDLPALVRSFRSTEP
jgi:hypothetical protein